MNEQTSAATAAAAPAKAQNPAHFDREGEFTIPLKRSKKTVTVRFPTDEEICRRQATIRTTVRRYGMDGSVTRVDNVARADHELLEAIKVSGDNLEEEEASVAISRLLRADAEEPSREGDIFTIPIRVVGGTLTLHKLRQPTLKEEVAHDDASTLIRRRHGSELKISTAAFGTFYDKLSQGQADGYGGTSIPLSHKLVAVQELRAILNAEDEEPDPENFG